MWSKAECMAPPAAETGCVQYVVVRRDLYAELDWPLGSIIAQVTKVSFGASSRQHPHCSKCGTDCNALITVKLFSWGMLVFSCLDLHQLHAYSTKRACLRQHRLQENCFYSQFHFHCRLATRQLLLCWKAGTPQRANSTVLQKILATCTRWISYSQLTVKTCFNSAHSIM